MKKLFSKHFEVSLAALSAVFLIIIVASYAFGIRSLARTLEVALDPTAEPRPPTTFDIEGAKRLDLKGLAPQ